MDRVSGVSPVEQEKGAPQFETRGSSAGLWVVGAAIVLSIAMGTGFYFQYSRTLLYVKATLESEDAVQAWETRALSPHECVDEAMAWASECRGVKSMCDMYVDRVIALCMGARDRRAYCDSIAEESPAKFGAEDCRLRGVQRHRDAEACAKSYGAIVSWCADLRARFAGVEPDVIAPRRADTAPL